MRPDGRPSGPARPEAARLFFALVPDRAVRDRFDAIARDVARRFGGKATRADTLHITLAFLGDTPLDRLPALLALAQQVRAPAFDLGLDQLGYWRHNRIYWAGCSQVPPALVTLVAALKAQLKAAQFPFDASHRDFVPHVTLVRKLGQPAVDVAPLSSLRWSCREFSLIRSHMGLSSAKYENLGCWPLQVPQNV